MGKDIRMGFIWGLIVMCQKPWLRLSEVKTLIDKFLRIRAICKCEVDVGFASTLPTPVR